MTPNINIELSKELGKKVRANLGQCYYNSWKAFDILEHQPGIKSLYYCEGFAFTGSGLHGWVIEHGWLEVNGQIVDVTFWKDPSPIYYPTLHLDKTELRKAMQHAHDGQLPLIEAHTWGRGGATPDEAIADLHHENRELASEWRNQRLKDAGLR